MTALRTACSFVKFEQILKFHERVISALILVASFARPKICSQLLRVNESLKFALRCKFIKRETRGLELRSACGCEFAKQSRPLIPLLNPLILSHIRSGMPRCYALHACLCQTKYIANFKIYERAYHGSKFSAKRSAAQI